jgi:hypothetical protein
MEEGVDPAESKICAEVRAWVLKVPIGLGLCPWAVKSQRKGFVRIVTCESDLSSDVVDMMLETEIELILRDGTPH